eukprot:scaffold19153_cov80-Skeletonema_menzelii.AAC.10
MASGDNIPLKTSTVGSPPKERKCGSFSFIAMRWDEEVGFAVFGVWCMYQCTSVPVYQCTSGVPMLPVPVHTR